MYLILRKSTKAKTILSCTVAEIRPIMKPESRPVTTAPVSTPGRTLVAYDFCTGILSEAQGVKDDFYNYWVAKQTSWRPGVTDQNILIGQVATRYTQLVDYIKEFDIETNPTEKKRIQNEMLALNRDSFFVDESNKSLRGYACI